MTLVTTSFTAIIRAPERDGYELAAEDFGYFNNVTDAASRLQPGCPMTAEALGIKTR